MVLGEGLKEGLDADLGYWYDAESIDDRESDLGERLLVAQERFSTRVSMMVLTRAAVDQRVTRDHPGWRC